MLKTPSKKVDAENSEFFFFFKYIYVREFAIGIIFLIGVKVSLES